MIGASIASIDCRRVRDVVAVRPAVSSAPGVPQIAPAFSPGVASITSAAVFAVSGSTAVADVTVMPPSMPRAIVGVILGSSRVPPE